MSHALIIIPLAMHCLNSPIIADDPVFGYDPTVARVGAVSCGYFIWDTVDSSLNSTAGFVLHAVCCVAVFLFSFRPFLAGFGPPFLLWELSTPFLNIHWFMDKLALSQSHPTLYLANALVFMLVFFLARIVYGGYQSFLVIQVMWQKRHEIPLHLHLIYTLGNLSLNALNWLWFSKMVKKMIARVAGEAVP
ncbi:TRAM/LAG1/CLN8 homology domain-containing protein, partial [Naematelia encephala]